MAYELKDGQGSLFSVAPDKRTERGPNATGKLMWNGVLLRVAAWKQEGRDGKPAWLSLKVTPWEDDRRDNAPPPPDDPDIPF